MAGFPLYSDRASPSGTLPAMVLSTCRWKATETLLCDGGLRLTGAETYARVVQLSELLASYGVRHGTTVALLGSSSVALAIAFFAASELGAICCFVHAYEREDHNANVLRQIDAKLLIASADESYRSKGARIAADVRVPIAVVSSDATGFDFTAASTIPARPDRQIGPDDPAILLLSSGTTGAPKAILHTHRSLLATAAAGVAIYGRCSDQDSVAIAMPPSFAAWTFSMLPFFAARARICFAAWTNANDYLALLERERVTMAGLVPTVWRMVIAADPESYDLSALQIAFFSGEPGSPQLVSALTEKIAPEVRTAYLASEIGCACGIAAGSDVLSRSGKAASVGRPVPNADLRIVDPDTAVLRDVVAEEIGEIAVRGASLAQGYWKNDELTRARFVDGWWRSGDLGFVDRDGYVFIKGRIDNRINSGGIKIHAEEVEAALLMHPDVAMAAVVGEPDSQWGERVVAHIVSRNPDLTAAAIIEYCATAGLLSSRKTPKAIYFRDQLPTGPTNKLYRQALKHDGGRSNAQ